jgi:hypothetical protein
MNDRDYTINPLPILPNVPGLNAAKDGRRQKKRDGLRKPLEERTAEDDGMKKESDDPELDHADRDGIDYCA